MYLEPGWRSLSGGLAIPEARTSRRRSYSDRAGREQELGTDLALHRLLPPKARAEYLSLRQKDRDDFENALEQLKDHPFRGGPGIIVERLSGFDDLWKIKLRHPQRRA